MSTFKGNWIPSSFLYDLSLIFGAQKVNSFELCTTRSFEMYSYLGWKANTKHLAIHRGPKLSFISNMKLMTIWASLSLCLHLLTAMPRNDNDGLKHILFPATFCYSHLES
jgi:hypothetical protein